MVGAGFEGDGAVDSGKNRVVDADPNARAGMPLGAALTHNNVAGDNGFAAELLDAETAASGIAAIAGRTPAFL